MNRAAAIDGEGRSHASASPHGEAQVIGEILLQETRYTVVALPEGAMVHAAHTTVADEAFHFEVAGRVCRLIAEPRATMGADRSDEPVDLLTKRELQIAGLVASGRINKQIASELNISEWTVSTHLRRIYSKLGIRTRAALAYRCAFLLTGTRCTGASAGSEPACPGCP